MEVVFGIRVGFCYRRFGNLYRRPLGRSLPGSGYVQQTTKKIAKLRHCNHSMTDAKTRPRTLLTF
jgi:hypothetical protein